MRKVILYPGDDGYWVVECPSLPGCSSQGETREAALSNIREAIDVYEEALVEQGRPIPEDLLEVIAL
jgi:predicted RNase H-like HicB family nuclease